MLTGIALRWHSVGVLGKYFTFDVAIHSRQVLVDTGPYRYIRHPSHSGALMSLLRFGLTLGIRRALPPVSPALASPMLITYPSRGRRWLRLSVKPAGNG
jgi:protein-S-isoprenylcysteine O-methyltransferase Ste14